MIHIWTPRRNQFHSVDFNRCRHAVDAVFRASFDQCGKRAKVVRNVKTQIGYLDLGFCGIHDPVRVAEKRAERARIQAEKTAEILLRHTERARQNGSRPAYIEALRAIEQGHNDPRTLAREVLALWGDLETTDP